MISKKASSANIRLSAGFKETLYQAGAVLRSMSGSGSSVFGLFEAPTQFKEQFTDCFVWEGQLP